MLLLLNPEAGRLTKGLDEKLASILSRSFEVESTWSASPRDATETAARAGAAGFDVVAAVGGDGTAHHVANGLIGTSVPLALVPAGTANSTARSLGISANALKAAAALADGVVLRRATVGRMATGPAGTHDGSYALSQVGMGFDAEVTADVVRDPASKRRWGRARYVYSVARGLSSSVRGRATSLRVSSGDRSAEASSIMVQIRWPYAYLGGLPIAFAPGPGRGGLTALVVERFKARTTTLATARSLTSHSLEGLAGIQVWDGLNDLSVETDQATAAQSDGELLGDLTSLQVSLAADGLTVAMPRSSVARPQRRTARRSTPVETGQSVASRRRARGSSAVRGVDL